MRLKLNKQGFSLLEVIIVVAIVTSAITVVFRAFAATISSAVLSQDISLSCFVLEEQAWEVAQKYKDALPTAPFNPDSQGQETRQGKEFRWNYKIANKALASGKQIDALNLAVSFARGKNSQAKNEIYTYLIPK